MPKIAENSDTLEVHNLRYVHFCPVFVYAISGLQNVATFC